MDVYGLAALAYATLFGVGPFEGMRPSMRLVAQLTGDIAAPSALRAELHESVDRVLLRALSPEPTKRPASVVAFVDALEQATQGIAPASRNAATLEPRSRGLIFTCYLRAAGASLGERQEAAFFASLPADVRKAFGAAVDAEEFYPAAPLVAYLRAYAPGDGAKLEALGAVTSRRYLPSTLTAICVSRTPEALYPRRPAVDGAVPRLGQGGRRRDRDARGHRARRAPCRVRAGDVPRPGGRHAHAPRDGWSPRDGDACRVRASGARGDVSCELRMAWKGA